MGVHHSIFGERLPDIVGNTGIAIFKLCMPIKPEMISMRWWVFCTG